MRILPFAAVSMACLSSGCALQPPVDSAAYERNCDVQPGPPPGGSLLFVTLRLPDCRRPPAAEMTYHRATKPWFGATSADGQSTFHSQDEWLKSAKQRFENAAIGGRPPVLFIHGYNNDQEQALDRARAISTALSGDRPVIALTWPSYASKARYYWDEANTEWVIVGSRQILAGLAASVPRVIIVAHSMGSRMAIDLARMLRRPDGTTPVEQLILAAPDVDREALANELQNAKPIAGRVTIYASRNDQALSASWRAHGQARAGDLSAWVKGQDPGHPYFKDIASVDVVDTTDVSLDFVSHDAFIASPEGAADLCRVIKNLSAGEARNGSLYDTRNYYSLVKSPAWPDTVCSRPGWQAAMTLRFER